jgi:hypothetical protein
MPCYKTLHQTKAKLKGFQLAQKFSFNLTANRDVSISVNENDNKFKI